MRSQAVCTGVFAAALVAAVCLPCHAGWNPFRKSRGTETTPADPFSSPGTTHHQMLDGKPLVAVSNVAASGKSMISRVGAGTKNMLGGIGRTLTFQRRVEEPQTISTYSPWAGSHKKVTKKRPFSGWFQQEAGPPETVQDWIAQDRPR